MSLEKALVTQAGPYMLAAKAQALIAAEVGKGCDSRLLHLPVALEPAYHPITVPQDIMALKDRPRCIHQSPPTEQDLVRYQVYISPDQSFDWNCFELFLKMLSLVPNRVGLEIVGNQERITIALLCHRHDIPMVHTAFQSKLKSCRLTETGHDVIFDRRSRAGGGILFYDYFPLPPYGCLLTQPTELRVCPYDGLITAMANIHAPAIGLYQVLFQPVSPAHNWHRNIEILTDFEYMVKLVNNMGHAQRYAQQAPSGDLRQMAGQVETKAHNDKPLYSAAFRIALIGAGDDREKHLQSLSIFSGLFQHGGRPLSFITHDDYRPVFSSDEIFRMFLLGLTYRPGFLVNSAELTGLANFPPISMMEQIEVPVNALETLAVAKDRLVDGTPIGTCNVAGQDRLVCIPGTIRMCHIHLVGKPGKGKSTLEEHMIIDDIRNGYGVAVLDPHGDLVERLRGLISPGCVEKTIYFDPGDPDWVPMWNPLQKIPGQDIGRMTDDLVGVLKSFVTGWGDRMEHILRHSIFALLHLPGSTLLDIADLLRSKSTESESNRKLILEVIENEEARKFWQHDFIHYRSDEFGPPKHKLSKLLVGGTISLMLSQPNSEFNFRRIMDDGMIFLGNLSNLGTEVREILGGFILATLHATALGRSEIPIEKRRPFHIYLDEAHRFVTDSLEEMIAETRKYGVSLTLAHQYLHQFKVAKIDALSSMGTTIVFNVDAKDAGYLTKDFQDLVKVKDIVNLDIGQAIVRCGTDIARISTLEPLEIPQNNCGEQIIARSRQKYCLPVPQVRQMVRRRSERANRPFEPLVNVPNPDSSSTITLPGRFDFDAI
jgi:hypothetical protein